MIFFSNFGSIRILGYEAHHSVFFPMVKKVKKILITGGAGFIGSHLCERLLQDGCKVICLDNLLTGSRENIGQLLKKRNFIFVKHDVRKAYYYKVDEIYNLACPASPFHYQRYPLETFEASVFGAFNALDLARKTGAKVLQASTSEVYGNPLEHPQKENYWGNVNPIGLRSCYDEGKRAAETIFMDYYRKYKIPIKIVRIFNTYGPKMAVNDGRVVSNFIVRALRNDPIVVYGDGSQTRSFQYVEDLTEGLIKMMETENFVGPVNLGNPCEFTVKELAEKIIELTGSKSQISFAPLPVDDPLKRKPDITLAKEKLNWEPKINLEEGLLKTIEYFRRKLRLK